jgi:sec-independent protein translocase protein TatB
VFNLGAGEITVILLLALIFLGPSKLPELATSLGKLIREIRKVTSDVKNEITLDDSFRKPFEELRDAVTLHPDELKRRDQWAREREEAAKRAADDAAKFAAETANGIPLPPDGLGDHVKVEPVSADSVLKVEARPATPKLPEPNGPNDTIVQTAPPRGATLDDIPLPSELAKPLPELAKPVGETAKPVGPPAGTVARTAAKPSAPTPAAPSVVAAPTAPVAAAPSTPPRVGDSNATQILSEEDLIPSRPSGTPPPPPHLPGLRPVGPPAPVDKKKS